MRLNESSKHSFYNSLMEKLEPEDEGKYYYKRFSGAGEIDYLEFDDEWEAHNYAEKVNKETGDETAVYDMYTNECLELFDAIENKELEESYAIVDYYDANGYEKEKIVNGKSPKDVETKVKRIADKYEVIDIHQASADVADSKYLNSLGRGVERKDYWNSTFEESAKLKEDEEYVIGDEEMKKYAAKYQASDKRSKEMFKGNCDPYSQPQEIIDIINKGIAGCSSWEELMNDYNDNPESDWYVDIIRAAQRELARRDIDKKEKEEKQKAVDEDKEYKSAKRELDKLRKEHSTRVGRIEYLFNLIKDYESKHEITEGASFLKESAEGIIEWIWGKDASPDNLSSEELDIIKKLDDRLGYFEDIYYAGHTSKEGCYDLIKDEIKESKYGLSPEEQEKLLKLYSRYDTGNEEDDVLTIDGIRFEDKSDAKTWLDEKIKQYGNTYFFPKDDKATLNKLINKFGNTYFWH